jgi:hypothetical protein
MDTAATASSSATGASVVANLSDKERKKVAYVVSQELIKVGSA